MLPPNAMEHSVSQMPVPRNHLLSIAQPPDLERLRGHLDPVDLRFGQKLQSAGEPIEFVYFPDVGVSSLIANFEDGGRQEVGLAGWDGMVGISVILGTGTAPTDSEVQIPGRGWRMSAWALRQGMEESPALTALLLRYVDAFHAQVSQTAACNAHHVIPERLARWLLMSHDRVDGEELPVTHEYLSIMLGVRRPGVTVAIGALAEAGFVAHRHGLITIVNRAGLEGASCECYALVRDRFALTLGWSGKKPWPDANAPGSSATQ